MKVQKLTKWGYLFTNESGCSALVDPIESLPEIDAEKTVVFLSRHQAGFFDRNALAKLPREIQIFIPLLEDRSMANELISMGFRSIDEVDIHSLVCTMGFKFRVTNEDLGAGGGCVFVLADIKSMQASRDELLKYPFQKPFESAYTSGERPLNVLLVGGKGAQA